jgi:hypothetical protein
MDSGHTRLWLAGLDAERIQWGWKCEAADEGLVLASVNTYDGDAYLSFIPMEELLRSLALLVSVFLELSSFWLVSCLYERCLGRGWQCHSN